MHTLCCDHITVNIVWDFTPQRSGIVKLYIWIGSHVVKLKCLHSAWCSGGHGTGRVCCPCAAKLPLDGVQGLDEVKNMIHKLYTSLNIDQHQVGVTV